MGRLKKLLGFLVIATVVYLAWMLLPVYFANFQFEDSIKSEAKFSATSTQTEDDIRKDVVKSAIDLSVPVTADMIQVVKQDSRVQISTKYNVVVNLIGGKQITLNFHPSSEDNNVF